MARVRRPRYLCFFCNDQPFPDVERLLRGEVAASTLRQLYALSILTGEEVPLTGEELEYVLSTPSDRWVEAGGLEESFVPRLMEHGVLLSDDGDERLAVLRRRDEELTETQWNLYGALYFFLTRWSHVDLRVLSGQDETGDLLAPTGEIIRSFLDAYGDPPAPFRPAANGPARVDLPVVNQQGELYDVLARRRTTRRFESDVPLPIEELSVVLRYVFGYHGYAPLFGQVMTLKRTSPSGGGLHPVEAYPLIRNVEGIEPGLYHYDARDHALERIAGLTGAEAGAAATDFVCGQTYFSAAHVLIVLAARFERAFWKYRKHSGGSPPCSWTRRISARRSTSSRPSAGSARSSPQRSTMQTSTRRSASTAFTKGRLRSAASERQRTSPRPSIPLSSRSCRARPSWANPRR